MHLLITAGGTREPIDRVRFLSNVSTGRTGARLADLWTAAGHHVHLLHGAASEKPACAVRCTPFGSAADLEHRLRDALATGGIDVVVMAAAVSDYRPDTTQDGKVDSDRERWSLTLVRNPKILPRIKSMAPAAHPPRVVGFKLTASASPAEVLALVGRQWSAGGVDVTVHNDLDDVRRDGTHRFSIFTNPAAPAASVPSVEDLAALLPTLW